MRLSRHPNSPAIEKACKALMALALPWAGDAYRVAEAPYATQGEILSGKGAAMRGQRWNPPGILTIYACLRADGAMLEWMAQRRKAGMGSRRHLPVSQITVITALHRVWDFRRRVVADALGQPLEAFVAEPHRAQVDGDVELRAQALGRLAVRHGAEAIIVPSAQKRTFFNMVIYPENLMAGSTVKIHGKKYLLP